MRPPAGRSPPVAGIGLRAGHYGALLEQRPPVGWLEVHSENYFEVGGKPFHYLSRAREHYPLSLHGVGLSIGSADPLNRAHLGHLRALIETFEPFLVSEHLSWGSIDGRYLNDLLPLPYTEEALNHFAARVRQVQDFLGRRILIENPSSYLRYTHSNIPEAQFLDELAQRADCELLLDVNNIHVSACNHDFDPVAYLDAIPVRRVKEIHLAGFSVNRFDDGQILIDTHNHPVSDAVWQLFRHAVRRFGEVPTLIEWDTDLPALEVLVGEARKADIIREQEIALVA